MLSLGVLQPVTRGPNLSRSQYYRSDTLSRLHTDEPAPVLRPQVPHLSRLLLPRVPDNTVREVRLGEHQLSSRDSTDGQRVRSVEVNSVRPRIQGNFLSVLLLGGDTFQSFVNVGQTFQSCHRNLLYMRNTEGNQIKYLLLSSFINPLEICVKSSSKLEILFLVAVCCLQFDVQGGCLEADRVAESEPVRPTWYRGLMVQHQPHKPVSQTAGLNLPSGGSGKPMLRSFRPGAK